MKKAFTFMAIIITLFITPITFAAETEIKAYINGQKINFDVQPLIEQGTTLVPLRAIFEAIGAQVDYDQVNQVITARNETTIVKLSLGSSRGFVNGVVKELTVPAKAIDGRTLVPLRFVSESFGAEVNYSSVSKIIDITTDNELSLKDIAKKAESVVIIQIFDEDGNSLGTGSGVIINNQGIIVTNFHVMQDAVYANVIDNNGNEYEVSEIIIDDEKIDISIIKANLMIPLPAVKIGNSSELVRGDDVIAIGSPLGLFQNAISTGILGSTLIIDGLNFLQVTAPISPGSSGGGLFNNKGELVGITSATMTNGQNLNLAIPIDDVKGLINQADINVSYASANTSYTGYAIESTYVFSAPDFESDKIILLPMGIEVTVVEKETDWQGNEFLKIKYFDSKEMKDISGYVFSGRIGVR